MATVIIAKAYPPTSEDDLYMDSSPGSVLNLSKYEQYASAIKGFSGWYYGRASEPLTSDFTIQAKDGDSLTGQHEYDGGILTPEINLYTQIYCLYPKVSYGNKIVNLDGLKEVYDIAKSHFPVAVSLGKKDGSSGTQSIGTTITKLYIGEQATVNTDASGEFFDITAHQVKCKKKGVVLVNASVYLTRPNSAGYMGLYLYKNGSENMSATQYGGASASFTVNLSTIVPVQAGDYFDIRGRASASSTFYYNNRCTTLDVMYIYVEPEKATSGYSVTFAASITRSYSVTIGYANGTTESLPVRDYAGKTIDGVEYMKLGTGGWGFDQAYTFLYQSQPGATPNKDSAQERTASSLFGNGYIFPQSDMTVSYIEAD